MFCKDWTSHLLSDVSSSPSLFTPHFTLGDDGNVALHLSWPSTSSRSITSQGGNLDQILILTFSPSPPRPPQCHLEGHQSRLMHEDQFSLISTDRIELEDTDSNRKVMEVGRNRTCCSLGDLCRKTDLVKLFISGCPSRKCTTHRMENDTNSFPDNFPQSSSMIGHYSA